MADERTPHPSVAAIRQLKDVANHWLVSDLDAAKRRWLAAVAGIKPVIPPASATPYELRSAGTGLDRRLRLLFGSDPLPEQMPDPLPWHPRNLWGFATVMDDTEAAQWTASAANRQREAEKSYERALKRHGNTGVKVCRPIAMVEPLAPTAFLSASPELIADLDHLTELAIRDLVPAFRHVPQLNRHVDQFTLGDTFLLSPPDLILGSSLVEVKSSQLRTLQREWARQLVMQLLWDTNDAYGLRELAIYSARHGMLVRFDLGEIFVGGDDSSALAEARSQASPFIAVIRAGRHLTVDRHRRGPQETASLR